MTNSPPQCPSTVTVRRNPPRRARPTPSSAVPFPLPPPWPSVPPNIPSFPIEEILSIEVQEMPKPELSNSRSSSNSSTVEPLSENLKVFLRIRPLEIHRTSGKTSKSQTKNAWPKSLGTKNTSKSKVKKRSGICITLNDSHSVTLCPPQNFRDIKRVKSEVFDGFSHVFSTESSQCEVYEKMVKPLVEDFLRGKSGMLAALGPSGSGKTHTMFGCPRELGMVPLALHEIFNRTDGCEAQSSRTFYLSMFEIYSEKGKAERMLDLLQDGVDLCLQQSVIKGLQEATIIDLQQAESLIANGMLKRSKAPTNSNSQSSRSQCIINIRSCPSSCDGGDQSNSVLTIIDLAGAEREKRTGNQGARLLESNFINKTSMVFGLCLRSLLEHQKNPKRPLQKHFQNSMLTRYLRDFLEGKKRMSLILTVKPGEEDYLGASFLLRQASPFMKLKYSNIEEPINLISSKRQIQAVPRLENLKRMKFSGNEACLVDEDKGEVIHQHHKEEVEAKKVWVESEECTGAALLNEYHSELKRSERNNKIMQGFAKAFWNVLKEYKKRLEDSQNEMYNLQDSLRKEKARCSDLESELNDLYSSCSCRKEASSEKHGTVSEIYSLQDSISKEKARRSDLQNELNDLKSYCSCRKEASSEKQDTENEIYGLQGSLSTEKARYSDQEGVLNDLKSSCSSRRESSSEGTENEIYNLRDSLSKEKRSCSGLESELNELRSSSSSRKEASSEESYSVADIAPCSVADSIEEQCHQLVQINENCPEIDSTQDLKGLMHMEKDIVHQSVESPDFGAGGLSESADSLFESLAVISEESSSLVEIIQLQKKKEVLADQINQLHKEKKWLKSAEIVKDDSGCSPEADDANNASKLVLCCKTLDTKKPKRRLLPASSILLKDMGGFDFDDENEKPKGSGRERKVAADDTKRTQGSISLLRLLRTNLPK